MFKTDLLDFHCGSYISCGATGVGGFADKYWLRLLEVRQIYAMALASVNKIVLSVRLPISHSKFNKKVLSSPASPLEIFLRMDLNCRVLATVLDLRS